jgi:ribosome biogenesis GTPase
MQGLVLKSTGSWYDVKLESGERVSARIRGKFRLDGLKVTNPVAAGDNVELEKDKDDNYVIHQILPRKNYIIRRSVNLSKQYHILATNLDQAILIVCATHPKTYSEFIDRFLVTATAYHIPAILVFNKIDLYGEEELAQLKEWEAIYGAAGYDCRRVSAQSGEGVEAVKELLKGKISMLSGHSGVGKSTLVNAVDSNLNLKTSEISDMHEQGKHTTTFAEMHELTSVGGRTGFGSFVIDTPGIKGLGLADMTKTELCKYFPEFLPFSSQCKFHNCVHVNEPGCVVKQAVVKGEIREERYKSYVNMYYDDDENYR